MSAIRRKKKNKYICLYIQNLLKNVFHFKHIKFKGKQELPLKIIMQIFKNIIQIQPTMLLTVHQRSPVCWLTLFLRLTLPHVTVLTHIYSFRSLAHSLVRYSNNISTLKCVSAMSVIYRNMIGPLRFCPHKSSIHKC